MSAERLNAADLREIENRANDATEGPWFIEGNTVMTANRFYTVVYFGESAEDDYDSAFIACSRADVPALVNEVRASWEEREALRAALTALCDANEQHHNAPPDWDRLDAALDAARALVGSAPQEPSQTKA